MKKVIYHEAKQNISIERVIRDYDYTMPTKHFHNEYELYYLIKGARYYFIEHESYLVNEGSLVIINKNQIHKTAAYENPYHERIVLEFHDNLLTNLASMAAFDVSSFFANRYGVLTLTPMLQKQVQYLLTQIHKELKQKEAYHPFLLSMYLLELLILAERSVNSLPLASRGILATSQKHIRVKQTATYIKNNLTNSLSLDTIAASQFLNKSYLSRIFKEVTGFTVNEYLSICRIEEAKKLLEETKDTVGNIAYHVGFESTSHFERVFKKYTESTPLKYRKKFLAQNAYARETRLND